jgi:murein DD-endopeptidase MepM/ murein hydrolase activator NlpD
VRKASIVLLNLLLGVWAAANWPVSAAEPHAAQTHIATVSATPGTLVRWSGRGTARCAMKGRSWAALNGTCYYPIDLEQKPGQIRIARLGAGRSHSAIIEVTPSDYGTEEITLPDIPQANPSAADLKRDFRDRALLARAWNRKEGPARFTLPLGAPAKPLPEGSSFGVHRVFNGKPAPQPHTGTDYRTPVGTTVEAVADGTVVIAKDMFFEGNAVFIDHGDGLFSMYFHLSEIKVMPGAKVRKGQALGRVGSTGRATGPHLFFGVRWHNARINPDLLLGAPSKIPSVDAESNPDQGRAKNF